MEILRKNSTRGMAVIRIITGSLLIYHGIEVFDSEVMSMYSEWEQFEGSFGTFMAYLGKSMEFITGVMLLLGWHTRLAGFLIAGTFLYITFIVDGGRFWYENQHPFLFALIGLIFMFYGSGTFSIDKPKD